MNPKGFLEDGFAGARLTEDKAKPSLLGMNPKGVEYLTLLGKQGEIVLGERIPIDAEMGTNHERTSEVIGIKKRVFDHW